MKKVFLVIFTTVLIISCNKDEKKVDLLTNKLWQLNTGLFSTNKETVKFLDNNTYEITDYVVIAREGEYPAGKITGDWDKVDNKIYFKTSKVDLIDNSNISSNPSQTGSPIGYFYGYIVDGFYHGKVPICDSISGQTNYNCLDSLNKFKDSVIVNNNSALNTWIINKLTEDSLIIDIGTKRLRYTKIK